MTTAAVLATLVDLVIGVSLVEVGVLLLLHRFTGGGVAPREFALNLVSGLCLMLALRAAVHDAGVLWIAACLLAAGLAHAADLVLRWRRGRVATIRRSVAT